MRAARPEDWPQRLHAYLAAAADQPFVWGRHDCATFSAGWLVALGYDSPLQGLAWSSALTALRLMRTQGGYPEAIAQRLAPLGIERIAPASAQRGDLVLLPLPNELDRYSLGIVAGARAFFVTPNGCEPLPFLATALAAYRV